jgi:hypothetical protein
VEGPDLSRHDAAFTPFVSVRPELLVSDARPLSSQSVVTLEELDGYHLWVTHFTWYSTILHDLSREAPNASVEAFGYDDMRIINICMSDGIYLGWGMLPISTHGLASIELPEKYGSHLQMSRRFFKDRVSSSFNTLVSTFFIDMVSRIFKGRVSTSFRGTVRRIF